MSGETTANGRIIAYGAVARRVLVCVYTWRGQPDEG